MKVDTELLIDINAVFIIQVYCIHVLVYTPCEEVSFFLEVCLI